MTSTIQVVHTQQSRHHPFVIRKAIVLSAAVLAIGGGCWFESIFLGIGLYFCLATLFDGLSYYALHLKSSTFANPEELLKSQWVTGEELDRYFDTRRYIRFVSLIFASVAFGIAFFVSAYALKAFCITYVASTLLGILYVRFFVKMKRPRLICRDDRYYFPRHLPKPGHITMAQFGLASSGSHPYGPVDV